MNLLSQLSKLLHGETRATCDKCKKSIYEGDAYVIKYGKCYHWDCAHRSFTYKGKRYIELGSQFHDPRKEINND